MRDGGTLRMSDIVQKNLPRGRERFQKYKTVFCIGSGFFSLFPRSFRMRLYRLVRRKGGLSGLAIRYILIKTLAKHVGDNVSIHPDVYLFHIENLSIGNNVSIHPLCYIEASGEIEISNDVSIAHGVTLISETHNFSNKDIAIKDQGITPQKICIENNVWIGAKATVLGGHTIAEGSIIGTGAVVTKSTLPFSIVAGVPAKEIKKRR